MKNQLSNKGWSKMRQLLDSEMPVANRKPFLVWWLSGAAVATIMILSFQYWANRTEVNQSEAQVAIVADSGNAVNSGVSVNDLQSENNLTSTQEKEVASSSQTNPIVLKRETSSNVNSSTRKLQRSEEPTSGVLTSRQTLNETVAIGSQKSDAPIVVEETTKVSVSKSVASIDNKPTQIEEAEIAEYPAIEHKSSFSVIASEATLDLALKNDSDKKSQLNPGALAEADISPMDNMNSEIANEKNIKSLGGYLGLSSGVNIVQPVSYVLQFGGGASLALSQRWGLQFGAGVGLNGLRHEASIGLVTESFRRYGESGFLDNNISGQALPLGTEAAELSLYNNWFTYLHSGVQYRCGKWTFGTGLDVAYRFDIQLNNLSQRAYDANAMPAQRSFTSAEIEEIFAIYNRIDIRPMVSIGFMVHPRLSVDLVYRHGLNPLLKFPLSGSEAAYNRNVQLGLGYHF